MRGRRWRARGGGGGKPRSLAAIDQEGSWEGGGAPPPPPQGGGVGCGGVEGGGIDCPPPGRPRAASPDSARRPRSVGPLTRSLALPSRRSSYLSLFARLCPSLPARLPDCPTPLSSGGRPPPVSSPYPEDTARIVSMRSRLGDFLLMILDGTSHITLLIPNSLFLQTKSFTNNLNRSTPNLKLNSTHADLSDVGLEISSWSSVPTSYIPRSHRRISICTDYEEKCSGGCKDFFFKRSVSLRKKGVYNGKNMPGTTTVSCEMSSQQSSSSTCGDRSLHLPPMRDPFGHQFPTSCRDSAQEIQRKIVDLR
ncbi:hypothetical protein AAG570_011584 [Ranatra chinensis]|uniref:Uncharacterized protein n=1 Tax=Ranatra chinensis TaxID=642074 RepID=A0ABD0YL24_9HEMI